MHANHLMKQSNCISSALTSQTGHPHWLDRWTRSPSTWELHQSDWYPSPVKPMPPGKLPELKNSSKPLGNLLNACNNCRMDLPGPTTSVGTRTDYSVGPWDYSSWAAQHLLHGAQGPQWRSTRMGSYACPVPCRELLDVPD
jgi:hypothetical protein